jgi:hypothetical protein
MLLSPEGGLPKRRSVSKLHIPEDRTLRRKAVFAETMEVSPQTFHEPPTRLRHIPEAMRPFLAPALYVNWLAPCCAHGPLIASPGADYYRYSNSPGN